jgi:hypothetical protein
MNRLLLGIHIKHGGQVVSTYISYSGGSVFEPLPEERLGWLRLSVSPDQNVRPPTVTLYEYILFIHHSESVYYSTLYNHYS